jgi:hypothetical protein
VGLPLQLFTPHVTAHVPSCVSYFKKTFLLFTVYQFSSSPLPPLLLPPCTHSLSQLPAPRHCMPIKRVTHRKRMAKKGIKKKTLGWTASALDEADLKKVKK